MTAPECICGESELCTVECEKHNRLLHGYPCGECQAEWQAKNPHTDKAISRLASGSGSVAAVNRARKLDEKGRSE